MYTGTNQDKITNENNENNNKNKDEHNDENNGRNGHVCEQTQGEEDADLDLDPIQNETLMDESQRENSGGNEGENNMGNSRKDGERNWVRSHEEEEDDDNNFFNSMDNPPGVC